MILLASYLHDFILFLIKKKFSSEICVLYVSSVKYSQSTHINLLYNRQFRWYRIYTDVVRKVGNFIILPLFHIVSATLVCNITIFYKMQNRDKYINIQEFKELHSLSVSHCQS